MTGFERPPAARIAATILAAFLTACGGSGGGGVPVTNPLAAAPAMRGDARPPLSVFAFSSSNATVVATYAANANGHVGPKARLKGSATQLSIGHGMAMGADGRLYVLSGEPVQLLIFSPGAKDNAAPERIIELPHQPYAEYTPGLAIDARGNFWIVDAIAGKVLRYSLGKPVAARPNLAIAPQLETPVGLRTARPGALFLDASGDLYVSSGYVSHGRTAYGVSEYAIGSDGSATFMRSFYDLNFAEVPASSMTVDLKGTVYLAASLNLSGVYAYAPGWKTGALHAKRRIGAHAFQGYELGFIAAMTTGSQGDLYVAQGWSDNKHSSIDVFPPGADGNPKPERSIMDEKNLNYPEGNYGTLLIVH